MRIIITSIIIVCLLANPCYANDAAQTSDVKSSGKFIAGFLTGYGAHEAGHDLSARMLGEQIEFRSWSTNWNYEGNPSRSDKRIILGSGFAVHIGLAQSCLQADIDHSDPYVVGVILSPLIQNGFIIARDMTGLIADEHNDFEQMDINGMERQYTYPLAIGIPLLQAWQLSKRIKQRERQKERERLFFNVNYISGGFMAGIGWKF